MSTLHTFGCSITQGFALPDTIQPILNEKGEKLTLEEVDNIDEPAVWERINLLKPSKYAWPKVLADKLGIPVVNHARRGACFNQIARQCAVAKDIKPDDIVIVMWTYLSRLSLQWPARTSVPFCSVVEPNYGWQTVRLGFNKLFGLSHSNKTTQSSDEHIQDYIENSTKNTYLNPLSVYDRYYNNLVLQQMTDGYLRTTGARIIHLSVEPTKLLLQLEDAKSQILKALQPYESIPHPDKWYDIKVDHDSCYVIHDTSIPPAENDQHPSIQHHSNFAEHVYERYFE